MVSMLGLANLGLLTARRRIGGSWIIAHKRKTNGTGMRKKRTTTIRKTRTTRKTTCGAGIRKRRIVRRRKIY